VTTPAQRNAEWRELCALLREVLSIAIEERPARDEFTADGRELGWVVHERGVMFKAVNRERAERGLVPVSLEAVEWAERRAVGHCDYVAQFAFGCARLVLGGESR
jgi:hypothetical protein